VAGRVRVGTGATASIYLLPPILRRLRARYPEVELVIVTGNTTEIAKAVAENALDVGVVTLPVRPRQLVVTRSTQTGSSPSLPAPGPGGAAGAAAGRRPVDAPSPRPISRRSHSSSTSGAAPFARSSRTGSSAAGSLPGWPWSWAIARRSRSW
jgi:DNA-binding transcriptional LysR family regulator